MFLRPLRTAVLGLLCLTAPGARGQIAITATSGGSNAVPVTGWYVQGFNGVLPTTNAAAWTNDQTLPGWLAATGPSNPSNNYTSITATFPSPTNTVAGTLYSVPQHFENNTPDSAYRALAVAPSGGTGPGHIALRFVNSTTSTITGFSVSYEMRWGYSQQGSVDSFDVIAGGNGYTSAPAVAVTGGTTNATGTAVVSTNGNVSSITKTASGSGYTAAPVVGLTGGGGSNALARAIMNLTTSSNSVTLSHKVFSAGQGTLTNFASAGWTTITATTNRNTTSSSVPDNWNYVTATVTNVTLAPGQEIWLNWQVTKLGSTGSSIAAIDNVRVGNFGRGNPAILAQPMPQSIILGNSATLAVTASASATPTYQWRRNSTNIVGATNAALVLSNAQPTDVGSYDVVVTSGASSVTSVGVPVQVYTRAGVRGGATNSLAVAPALTNWTADPALRDLAVANTSAYTNTFDLYLPQTPAPLSGRPAVVIIHGGGGNDGDKADGREVQAAQEFASHGYVALSINYKRSFQTKSTGNWTTAWPQNIKDAKTAVRWLRANATNYGLDPNRIGALGFSWGGNEAAMLAVTDGDAALDPSAEDGLGTQSTKVACAANFYGAVQIPDYHNMNQFGGNGVPGSAGTMDFTGGTNNYPSASPASRPTNTAAPMLLHHGDADLEVMPTQNEALRAALINAGSTAVSVSVPGGKHSYSLYETDAAQGGSTNNPIDVRAHTIGFFDQYLLPRAPAITSATNVTQARSASFTYQPTANNAPTQFAATGLPGGWSIDPVTGLITGTMPSSGTTAVTVYATGASGTAVSTLTFAACESITVSNTVAGTTPELLGYNLGHLTDAGNGFDWFRYSGVKGARIFISASELQSQTSPARSLVTSEAAFWDTIAKARATGTTKSTYIRWSDFNYDYTSSSGNNDITFKYAFTQLKGLGVEMLVNITASPGTFPITSATDWAGRWELWQHYYAQAYLLARDYDIRRFSMFNEPNNWSPAIAEADWMVRLRICSDAIQTAIADVNAARGKSLVPRIYAPNTANGKEKYNTAADTWGRDTIVNRTLQLSGTNSSTWSPKGTPIPWRLSQVYNYQKYSMLTDDDSGLTGYITDLNTLKSLIAADLGAEPLPPLALTEYNVRTGANYDTRTESQDTPSDYVALGANSIGLASSGASELFLFKFGQTASGGVNYEVAKNGTHYVQNASGTDNNYGGATKAAEVYRLLNKAAQGGRQRYAFSTTSGAASSTTSGLWTLVTRDPVSGFFYVFLANKRTTSIPLELNVSSLGVADQSPVFLEEVGAGSSADGVPVGNIVNGRVALGSIPGETVWLVTIPSAASGLTSIPASEDTQLSDGAGRNLTGALVTPMLVRDDGTANGRKAALIKIPVSTGDLAANKSFYLDLEVALTSGLSASQSHVYGVNDDSWSDDSATWAGQTSFLRQNVGNGTQIASNVVRNMGATPAARMLGQIVATSTTPSRTAIDVTEFVKAQTDGFASFLVVQDHRWDYSAEPVATRTTGDVQTAGVVVTSREKQGGGPRLLGVSSGVSTSPPVVLVSPQDRYLDIGASTTLSIAVDRSLPSTIQWRRNGVIIPGANTSTLTLSGVSVADGGQYTVDVTNANGTTTSAAGYVAINAAPVLVTPLGNVLATVGDPVTLSAEFAGAPPPNYVWKKDNVVLPGATSAVLSFTAAADSGGTYTVIADNGLGTASSSATVTVENLGTGKIAVTSTNSGITENFDTLGKSTSLGVRTTNYLIWTNGEGWAAGTNSVWNTKPGWYAATDDNRSPFEGYRTLNNGNSDPSLPPPRAQSGLASMGTSSSDTDRSLGAIPWTNNRVFFGLRLQNNTGVPLQGFTVTYRMEQYSATTAANSGTKLTLATAVNPASLRSPGFANVATNTNITTRASSYGRIDGTSATNSALRTNVVRGLSIAPGDSAWVRWEVSTSTAEALAFAIDDLVITNFAAAVAPVITVPPVGSTNISGQPVTFAVTATGAPTPSIQWRKDGTDLPGQTNASFTIPHVETPDAGDYSVRVWSLAGTNTSAAVPLVVNTLPVFLTQPTGQGVAAGANVTLTALASGLPSPSYQWQKDGTNLPGATFPGLSLTNVQTNDAGIYSVLAINAAGTNSSDLAPLLVTNAAPPFTQWKTAQFGAAATDPAVAGASADPDGDGLANTLEYALGRNPLAFDSAAMVVSREGGNLVMSYTKNALASDVVTRAQSATALAGTNGWTTNDITETNLSTSNNLEQWRATTPESGRPSVFLRLLVEPVTP